jgi:DNA-directed RNA polymerase subunit L
MIEEEDGTKGTNKLYHLIDTHNSISFCSFHIKPTFYNVGKIAINADRFDKLITALRTAVDKDGTLDSGRLISGKQL